MRIATLSSGFDTTKNVHEIFESETSEVRPLVNHRCSCFPICRQLNIKALVVLGHSTGAEVGQQIERLNGVGPARSIKFASDYHKLPESLCRLDNTTLVHKSSLLQHRHVGRYVAVDAFDCVFRIFLKQKTQAEHLGIRVDKATSGNGVDRVSLVELGIDNSDCTVFSNLGSFHIA
jgi:hypothetical protein